MFSGHAALITIFCLSIRKCKIFLHIFGFSLDSGLFFLYRYAGALLGSDASYLAFEYCWSFGHFDVSFAVLIIQSQFLKKLSVNRAHVHYSIDILVALYLTALLFRYHNTKCLVRILQIFLVTKHTNRLYVFVAASKYTTRLDTRHQFPQGSVLYETSEQLRHFGGFETQTFAVH
jgi:hypothetical protein